MSILHIAEGITALRRFPIDRLPPHIKAKAAVYIRQAAAIHDEHINRIERLLNDYARSPLIEPDTSTESEEQTRERLARLKRVEGLYPGVWRGRKSKGA